MLPPICWYPTHIYTNQTFQPLKKKIQPQVAFIDNRNSHDRRDLRAGLHNCEVSKIGLFEAIVGMADKMDKTMKKKALKLEFLKAKFLVQGLPKKLTYGEPP